jgi:hypothetical protein
MYAMNNDTVVSPAVVVILGTMAWVFALLDIAIDGAFDARRGVDRE